MSSTCQEPPSLEPMQQGEPQSPRDTSQLQHETVDTPPNRPELDWDELRRRSLDVGGFGERRAELWPKILGVRETDYTQPCTEDDQESESDGGSSSSAGPGAADSSSQNSDYRHPDERQIKLDTDRSFVLYPVDKKEQKDALQTSLHDLLVSLFRKRQKLGYFQGYHDIITVIYLTVPPPVRFACAEKISLHRVRDSMGSSLEPVLGLLRITKYLLRLADKEFAYVLERTSPLPFYALSNLLTLLSHDMPTLPLIQHVFDYLLCRPPIAIVYLTAVIILTRKEEVLALELEGEEGMAHSLLSSLPEIVDEPEHPVEAEQAETLTLDPKPPESTTEESPVRIISPPETSPDPTDSPSIFDSTSVREELSSPPTTPARSRASSVSMGSQKEIDGGADSSDVFARRARSRSIRMRPPCNFPTLDGDAAIPSLPHTSRSPSVQTNRSGSLHASRSSSVHASRSPSLRPRRDPESRAPSPSPLREENPPPYTPEAEPVKECEEEEEEQLHAEKARLHLSELLIKADELRATFPPDHPELQVAKIMGPQSVVFTWKELSPSEQAPETNDILAGLDVDTSAVESEDADFDDLAEAILLHPELIVYPYDPASEMGDETKEKEDDWDAADDDAAAHPAAKDNKRKRRKLVKARRFDVKTKTVVAGAVIVLSVAVAVYGMRAARGGHVNLGPIPGLPSNAHKKWTQGQQWFSGALVGAAMKIAHVLGGAEGVAGEL